MSNSPVLGINSGGSGGSGISALRDRTIRLATLSIPMIGNAIFSQMINLITMLYVGRLDGAVYMGAATLGNMLCNISGYSLAFGMCCALDTLIAQAYGAKLYSLMGLHAQRAALILTLFSIPVSLIWVYTDTILKVVLFIDEETANLAGEWARYIVFGLWPTLMFQIQRRFLQSCGIIWPTIIANIISTLSVVVGTYVMIYRWHWGFAGAAIGVVFSQWMRFLVLMFLTWGLMCIMRVSKTILSEETISTSLSAEYFDEQDTDTDSLISSNLKSSEEGDSPRTTKELFQQHRLESESPMIELVATKISRKSDEEQGFLEPEQEQFLMSEENELCCLPLHSNTSPSPLPPPPSLLPPLLLSQFPSPQSKSSFLPSFPLQEAWPPWSIEVFHKWPIFLSLALPAALSLFLEWGSYEVMAGFAGQLGSIQLATHGVYMNTASLAYNGPLAIADATSVLAGNYLGNNQPSDASSMVLIGVVIDSFLGLITGSILLFFLRSSWGSIFTSDADVIEAVHRYMPILFLYMFVDSVKCVTCNVLRSTGRPTITTSGNLFCCLFVLIPTGWYLALRRGWGLIGLWGGMSIGWGLAALIYSVVLYRTDWKQQAAEAYERNRDSSNKCTDSQHLVSGGDCHS